MPAFKDLSGHRYGDVTVLHRADVLEGRKRVQWVCRCEACGNQFIVLGYNIRNGNTKSCCGDKRHKVGSESPAWRGYEGISGYFWAKAQRGAKDRNISWDLTVQQAWDLWVAQGGVCALSGWPLELYKNRVDRGTASIDRIDSSQGYRVDNIQWVNKDLNIMKNKYDQAYFIQACLAVSKKIEANL